MPFLEIEDKEDRFFDYIEEKLPNFSNMIEDTVPKITKLIENQEIPDLEDLKLPAFGDFELPKFDIPIPEIFDNFASQDVSGLFNITRINEMLPK